MPEAAASGSSQSSDSSRAPFERPGVALGVAAVGFIATVLISLSYARSWRTSLLTQPPAVLALLDLVIVLAPYVVAVIVAVRLARGDTGLRGSTALGILTGIFLGVLARGVTELLVPTTGSLTRALSGDSDAGVVAGLTVSIAGAVLVSPFVEELFFRGVVQRATAQLWSGGTAAIVASVIVSVVAFVAAHLLVADATAYATTIAATLPLGIAAALATGFTRGIGAALAAHIVFNLGGVLLLLL